MTQYRKVQKSKGVRGCIKQHWDIDNIFYVSYALHSAYGRQWVYNICPSQAQAEDWLKKMELAQKVLTVKYHRRCRDSF